MAPASWQRSGPTSSCVCVLLFVVCSQELRKQRMIDSIWNEAQKHEANYWGNCHNFTTWGEYVKGEMYGREMGLFADYGTPHGELDMQGRSILDVGGGPVSMTLRCINAGRLVVADPCEWPPPVHRRYGN